MNNSIEPTDEKLHEFLNTVDKFAKDNNLTFIFMFNGTGNNVFAVTGNVCKPCMLTLLGDWLIENMASHTCLQYVKLPNNLKN